MTQAQPQANSVVALEQPITGIEPPEASASGGGLNLARLWRVILRRRRPFALVAILVASVSFGRSVHQQLFEPNYDGQFTLLISDPINPSGRGGGQGDNGSFESLARNSQAVDVPTLIAVLQSNTVLEPVYNTMRKLGYQNIPGPSVQLVNAMSDGSGGGCSRAVCCRSEPQAQTAMPSSKCCASRRGPTSIGRCPSARPS